MAGLNTGKSTPAMESGSSPPGLKAPRPAHWISAGAGVSPGRINGRSPGWRIGEQSRSCRSADCRSERWSGPEAARKRLTRAPFRAGRSPA